jgi:hypothetical protein
MPKVIFKKGEDLKIVAGLLIVLLALSLPFAYWQQARANTGSVTITTSVAATLNFTTTTSATDEFGTTTPGTAKFATTTLNLSTNDTLGWTTALSGDTKNTSNNNLQLLNASSTQIPDQTEWVPGTATSTAGNATSTAGLTNSGNVLAFRVMTASSTNGAVFVSTAWWGSQDNYSNNLNTLWAGIASSTVLRTIGNAGAGSYSASAHLNTVNYYLNPPLNQSSGNYIAPVTFTAVGN